ncbi:MAG: type I restriction enzyme HsdR N-terminal domain-containing protein [Cyclobacteriaceae bacterium]
MMDQQLNLPKADIKIKNEGEATLVWDIIRRKYIVLTPEEWVRQHFIHFLVDQFSYPKTLMKVETGLKVNKMDKRSDLVVLNRSGEPWMLVECKSPFVSIDQDTLIQAVNYNRTYKAPFLVLTNGMSQVICNVNEKGVEVIEELPPYPIS